eukprot:TRINITY_DN45012_c0_g1_i1.p1 TRINITY_DN45012_c0_g1~~TRINITY_DN45012_c0_g1_i1.p1  ORF type:complete len:422 (-),score=96.08 TRINITY_DN45012_c0_g1_i1:138-1403(-)
MRRSVGSSGQSAKAQQQLSARGRGASVGIMPTPVRSGRGRQPQAEQGSTGRLKLSDSYKKGLEAKAAADTGRRKGVSSGDAGNPTTPPRNSSGSRATGRGCEQLLPSPGSSRLCAEEVICAICCEDISCGQAVTLGCRHGWYCRRCVRNHAEARLGMGDVQVQCPECRAPVPERDLRKLLPADVVDQLLARSLERAVSSQSDLLACPTPNCPFRVSLDEHDDGENARLRCPCCRKTSCLRCGAQPFHRGLTCQEHEEKVRTQGAREAEEGLRQWMEETGSKQCPTCRIVVTKQNLQRQGTQYMECHKMMCLACNTRFCFKCLAVLTDDYTCGCSIAAHGFIDPRTGKRLVHLNAKAQAKKAKGRGRSSSAAAKAAKAKAKKKAAAAPARRMPQKKMPLPSAAKKKLAAAVARGRGKAKARA